MNRKMRRLIENRFYSRRQFLAGSGAFLALPVLSSLMPVPVFAQANNRIKRVVFVVAQYGIEPDYFFPSNFPDTNAELAPGFSDIYVKPIPSSGQLSIGLQGFTDPAIRAKMNIYRGLDGASSVVWGGHSYGVLSGSWESADLENSRIPRYGKTMDLVIAQSATAFERSFPVPVMRVGMTGGVDDNFSFDRDANGNIRFQSYHIGDRAFFNKMFGNFTGGGAQVPALSQADQDKRFMIDKVLEDYNTLKNHKRLSASDKMLLDQFATGLFETEKKLQFAATPPAECSKPALTIQGQKDLYWHYVSDAGVKSVDALLGNTYATIKHAFMCDMSRIAVVGSNVTADNPKAQPDPHIHENEQTQAQRQSYNLTQIHKWAQDLAATPDPLNPGTTMLDNTLIMYTNEHGNLGHHTRSLPVITVGSLGGTFKTGYYFDYRQRPLLYGPYTWHNGRPYKQLLIAIMEAMGVSRSEYMAAGKGGFGSFYNDGGIHTKYASVHNDPLPFIRAA